MTSFGTVARTSDILLLRTWHVIQARIARFGAHGSGRLPTDTLARSTCKLQSLEGWNDGYYLQTRGNKTEVPSVRRNSWSGYEGLRTVSRQTGQRESESDRMFWQLVKRVINTAKKIYRRSV
jgi:hypothetical protein